MFRETTYRTYGAGTLRRIAAIDMLLLWSKVFRCHYVALKKVFGANPK